MAKLFFSFLGLVLLTWSTVNLLYITKMVYTGKQNCAVETPQIETAQQSETWDIVLSPQVEEKQLYACIRKCAGTAPFKDKGEKTK